MQSRAYCTGWLSPTEPKLSVFSPKRWLGARYLYKDFESPLEESDSHSMRIRDTRGNGETSLKRLKCIFVNTLPLTSPFQRFSKQFYMVLVLKLRRGKASIWEIDLLTVAWWIYTQEISLCSVVGLGKIVENKVSLKWCLFLRSVYIKSFYTKGWGFFSLISSRLLPSCAQLSSNCSHVFKKLYSRISACYPDVCSQIIIIAVKNHVPHKSCVDQHILLKWVLLNTPAPADLVSSIVLL